MPLLYGGVLHYDWDFFFLLLQTYHQIICYVGIYFSPLNKSLYKYYSNRDLFLHIQIWHGSYICVYDSCTYIYMLFVSTRKARLRHYKVILNFYFFVKNLIFSGNYIQQQHETYVFIFSRLFHHNILQSIRTKYIAS